MTCFDSCDYSWHSRASWLSVYNGDTGVTGELVRSVEVGHRGLNEPFSDSVVKGQKWMTSVFMLRQKWKSKLVEDTRLDKMSHK